VCRFQPVAAGTRRTGQRKGSAGQIVRGCCRTVIRSGSCVSDTTGRARRRRVRRRRVLTLPGAAVSFALTRRRSRDEEPVRRRTRRWSLLHAGAAPGQFPFCPCAGTPLSAPGERELATLLFISGSTAMGDGSTRNRCGLLRSYFRRCVPRSTSRRDGGEVHQDSRGVGVCGRLRGRRDSRFRGDRLTR
jgi:hypothetical protein